MYTIKNNIISKNYYIDKSYRVGRAGTAIVLFSVLLIFASMCFASGSGIPGDRSNEKTITDAARNATPAAPSVERLIELAKTDHIELLEWSMALYDRNIKDYTAVLHKQERIDGKLIKPQEIAFWFRDKPYSLLMKWEKNAVKIDKLLYVEGRENNNMYVHPTGSFAWIKSVKRDPKCEEALKGSLKTADEFGFYRNMLYLHKVLTKAQSCRTMKSKYLGKSNVYGCDTVAMETTFTGDDCRYRKIIMHFDTKHILPLALVFYDRSGKLYGSYAFSDLKLNTGITEETFCKDKNKM
ncbi:MAG: DUF1571 domain-containing protein [Phycisphaerae bacterium]|nr:DUF1571 domain-containing protein [Phycisphaerae bacterium]